MGGILKNPLPKDQVAKEEEESIAEFRKQVYKNTQLNAKLTSSAKEGNHIIGTRKSNLPKDILSMKHEHDAEEQLQWNQRNLAENEITKQQYQDIHVDEPKTPYQGAVDPDGEYYKADDDLDDFSLGEAEYQVDDSNGDVETKLHNDNNKTQQELDEEEKHRRFQELRKQHYNKEAVKNRSPCADD